jgi:hypothetical protein
MTRRPPHRTASALSAAAITALSAPSAALAVQAFPGAQGFGANAIGGRTGDVYHVTSLADTNTAGTLRNAISTATTNGMSGRTIVFDVGGTITLTSDLNIQKSYLTIAGQTAPGPGITIIGKPSDINTTHGYYKVSVGGSSTTQHDIIRYLTFRRGDDATATATDDAFGILGSGSTHDIIVDHVSASWATDENLSPTNHSTNISVQYTYNTESLNPDAHAYGTLVRPEISSSMSFSHNLYADNLSRNPRIGNYNGTLLQFDFRNNVIYNVGNRASYTGGASETALESSDASYVGNYLISGPSTSASASAQALFLLQTDADPVYVRMFQSDNKVDLNKNGVRDGTDTGWGAFVESNAGIHPFPVDSATGKQMPSAFVWTGNDYNVTDTADDAYAKILAWGGGSLPGTKSAIDARIVAQMTGSPNTGAIITAPNLGEWTALYNAASVSRPVGFDTDNDGMPNAWETARGLNTAADDHTTIGPNAYTNLENYLNYLTLIANWKNDASGNWSPYLNWQGLRPSVMDSTANFGNVTTAARTVLVDAPVTVGQMSFDSGFGYTLAGGNAITVDVMSGTASIDVLSGSHTISAPLVLSDFATTINVAPANSTLTISNLTAATSLLTKNGAGLLKVNNVRAPQLLINAGTVQMLPNGTAAGTSKVPSLVIIAGSKLDLSDNKLITQNAVGSWTGSAYNSMTGLIASGRNAGAWDGATGIVTSQSTATTSNLTSIGIARASDVRPNTASETALWSGQTITGTDTLIMYTYGGDATLDGQINIDDYVKIDSGIAAGLTGWSNGDFNYDGKINIDDYTTFIDANIVNQSGIFLTASGGPASAGPVTVVPEPASGLLAVGATAALSLRRRRRS